MCGRDVGFAHRDQSIELAWSEIQPGLLLLKDGQSRLENLFSGLVFPRL
jgi:hypothetical protein